MSRHPLVALFEVEPLLVIAFFGAAFLVFAVGMTRSSSEGDGGRVVIVDDDPDVRRGLRALIETRTPLVVVGEAADGRSGVDVVDATRPDVVIVDVKLPHVDGIQLARHVRRTHPAASVIAYSAAEDDATGAIMLRAGAAAHLVKGDQPDRIIATLLEVVRHRDPAVAKGVAAQ